MAFFKIGPIEVEIQVQGPSLTYRRVGPVYETYSGRTRSQVRAIKRIWQGALPPLNYDDADAIVAAVGTGITTVGGEWPGEDNIEADVEILSDVPIKDDREVTKGSLRVLTVKATEILTL